MKKKVLGFLSIVILTMIMTGCGGDEKSVQNGNLSVQSESVESVTSPEETVSEIDVINDKEEIVTETDTANVEVQEKNLTQFESDFGYTISYEEDSFDYRRTEGYDEFVLKSDAVADRLEGHPLFFLCGLHIVEGKIVSIEERFVP